MSNVQTEIYNAFETAVQSLVDAGSLPIIQQENVLKRLGDDSESVRITNLPAMSKVTTLGPNGLTESRGLVQIDVFYPDGAGASTPRLYVDVLLNYFQPGLQMTSNSVVVQINNSYAMVAYGTKNKYTPAVRIEYSSWNNRTL
jgi:hypothetical protein